MWQVSLVAWQELFLSELVEEGVWRVAWVERGVWSVLLELEAGEV